MPPTIRRLLLAALMLALPCTGFSHPCQSCHPQEVAGYARTGMGRSLHAAVTERDGDFVHAKSGSHFLIRSTRAGVFQRMEQGGETLDYRIDYVIGSGNHASCYLARVGDHLFYSPICYYPTLGWNMAPGYADLSAPAYVRPISEECLLCHSGHPLPISNSLNRYQTPAFSDEPISCDRCHGDSTEHIKYPVRGSILSIAKLEPNVRDSICERCHLSGERVTNPGKKEGDFHPGMRLEEVFSSYVWAAPTQGIDHFKILSSEQLPTSMCWKASNGKMWCGSCHGFHSEELRRGNKPADVAAYYRDRCLACHTRAFTGNKHPSRTSDCIACHMPKSEVEGPYHSIFTDHRIKAVPQKQPGTSQMTELHAWREPAPEFRERNLALAYCKEALRLTSPELMARSYGMLLAVQKTFPDDPDVLTALGNALLFNGDALPAAGFFERVLQMRPNDPGAVDSAARAWLEAGDKTAAARHFEQALALDPLLVPDIDALLKIYRESGDKAKETALMDRVQAAMRLNTHAVPPKR